MRRINIPKEAFFLHGFRFSGYIESVIEFLAAGCNVWDGQCKLLSYRPEDDTEIALTKEYYGIFIDFYEQGGDLALSDPDETWQLISDVDKFYKRKDVQRRADIITRWNNMWEGLIDYKFFTQDKAPELRLEYCDSHWKGWRTCKRIKPYHWSSREFVQRLNISVCPYCNLNLLPMDPISKGKRIYYMSPDMDHYFYKGRYPFLSLNLYNFVPACDICNRRIKESREVDYSQMSHPYMDDVHEQVIVKVDEDVIDNPYMSKICDEWLSKETRGDVTMARRGLKWFDFFGILELCKNINRKQRLITSLRNAAEKEGLHQFYRKKFLGHMTDEQFNEQCYGCSLNPDDINKWPLSKITIDLVAQVEERKKLGRDVYS